MTSLEYHVPCTLLVEIILLSSEFTEPKKKGDSFIRLCRVAGLVLVSYVELCV